MSVIHSSQNYATVAYIFCFIYFG